VSDDNVLLGQNVWH